MNEVKETVYIAISSMLLALVLTLISIFLGIRSNLADTRNNEILSANSVLEYRQFNKYDNATIYGDEVIELIRLYYNTGIEIYIDTSDNTDGPILINEANVKIDPTLIELSNLQEQFKSEHEYVSQVVYNAVNPATVTSPMNDKPIGSVVTGISVQWITNN